MPLGFSLGVLLGYVGSIPAAGPLAASIVAAALAHDRSRALRLAIGGAVAETLWAAVALLGVSRLVQAHASALHVLRGVGAVVFVALGASMLRRRDLDEKPAPAATSDVALGFVIVATNPGFLVAWTGFAALLSSFGLAPRSKEGSIAVACGAPFGIVGWFSTLFALVARLRDRFSTRTLGVVVRGLGVLVIGFGVWLAISAVRPTP